MCRVSESFVRLTTLVWFVAIAGCSEDERLARLALQASAQQAEQNQELAHLNREVAEATRRLIDSRGHSDQQILDQQRELYLGRDQLEAERHSLAIDRNREPLLASIILTVCSLLVCSLPLILCGYLLHRLGPATADDALTQLLIDELTRLPRSDEIHGDGLPASDRVNLLMATDAPSP